ncbi:MAG TPA: hypothetical protein VFZ93_04425 [Albitalea sp.]
MMEEPVFEVRGEWRLTVLPSHPAPWMVPGRTYVVVLRRCSSHTLPEAEVRDIDTGEVLARYSWRHAREIFRGRALRPG